MKKFYAFLLATVFAAVAYADDAPDLSGYWDFTGIVNTGGNWSADKASADPSTITFAAAKTDDTNYTFTYVGDNSRNFKGRVVNDSGKWWLYVDKDPRGPQPDDRYLQVECGMINASGAVGGYYNFRFSIDEDEIGQTVQMAMMGPNYADLLSGYSTVISWDSYADGSYGMGSRQVLWAFIFKSCEKGAAPVVPTVTITDTNVEETATSATVTASVNTADLPVDATVSVEYAVVADKAQQADYTAMTLNDDQYEATISFDTYAPGEYFVMVKATAKSGEEVVASAGPEEAGTFTVTASIEAGEVTVTESPEGAPTQATITVAGVTGVGLVGADITVSYKLNDGQYVEMTRNENNYEATVLYNTLAAGTYNVTVKAEATSDDESIASDEQEDAATFTVTATIEAEEATVTESPEGTPTQATITVAGVTGVGLVGADITVSYKLNDGQYVEMTYNEDEDNYEATVLYNTLAAGTYNVTVKVEAANEGKSIASAEKSAGSFTVTATIEIEEATVTESPEGTPTQATITVAGVTGMGLVGADITVSYKLNDGQYVEMTYNEDNDNYEATVLYNTLAAGTYNVTVKAEAANASVEKSAGSFTVDESAGIDSVCGDINGAARFYNLQGIEVDNPVKGNVYIKVVNGKSTKIVK